MSDITAVHATQFTLQHSILCAYTVYAHVFLLLCAPSYQRMTTCLGLIRIASPVGAASSLCSFPPIRYISGSAKWSFSVRRLTLRREHLNDTFLSLDGVNPLHEYRVAQWIICMSETGVLARVLVWHHKRRDDSSTTPAHSAPRERTFDSA